MYTDFTILQKFFLLMWILATPVRYPLNVLKHYRQARRNRALRESIKKTTGFSDSKIDEIEARLEGMGELGETLNKGFKSGSVKFL